MPRGTRNTKSLPSPGKKVVNSAKKRKVQNVRSRLESTATAAMENSNSQSQNRSNLEETPKRKIIKVDSTTGIRRIVYESETNTDSVSEMPNVNDNRTNYHSAAVERHPERGDGIDIDVNSQDEELDYIDDVDLDGEDSGVIEFNNRRAGAEPMDTSDQGLLLGATGSSVEEERKLLENPYLRSVLRKMVDERIQQAQIGGESSKSTVLTTPTQKTTKPGGSQGKVNKSGEKTKVIKSPSDTTIYRPALNRQVNVNTNITPGTKFIQAQQDQECQLQEFLRHNVMSQAENNVMNKVSNFVDTVRAEQEFREMTPVPPGHDEAQNRADQAILDAECFKAAIEKPQGNYGIMNQFRGVDQMMMTSPVPQLLSTPPPVIGTGCSDDDFFHLTSHIDKNLKAKIEKGEFVDLDRLLPKERNGVFDPSSAGDEQGTGMRWVQRDGGTFLEPVKRASKITNLRRWEQAFRVYATMYCSENPNRSREIWQYISVINTASSAYAWDNVYGYDVIFRQLMEFNPSRSWAVTYNQMWNLSMRDPISRYNQNSYQQNSGGNNFRSGGNFNAQQKRPKNDYCWSFNKGIHCRFGKNCKYIERCSYCDATNHGVIHCKKLEAKGNYTSNHSWRKSSPPSQSNQHVSKKQKSGNNHSAESKTN